MARRSKGKDDMAGEPRVWRFAAARPEHLTQSQRERLAMLIGDRKSAVALLSLSSIIAAFCEAGILAIAARSATDLVHVDRHAGATLGPLTLHISVSQLLLIGCALAVVRTVLQIPISYYPSKIGGDVQAAMRSRLAEAYSRSSWSLQSQDREGHFQELMTNQIQQASSAAMQATALITWFSTFTILVLAAFTLNFIAACAVFGAAAVLFAALRPANRLTTRLSRQLSAAQLAYAGSVGETNRMSEETNVYGVSEQQAARVTKFALTSRDWFVKMQIVGRLIPNLYQSLIYLVLVFGLFAVSQANVRGISSLGAVVLLSVRAGGYGQSTQSVWVSLRQSLPFVERVQNAISAYRDSAIDPGDVAMPAIDTLAFVDLGYEYQADRPVLHGLDFQVTGGETIGVVGPSGAGKSTMVQILLRLREPTSGQFLVNGTTAARIRAEDWHAQVSYVPQAPKLIHATVAENVRFYRDYDDAAVERACRLARIHDDIVSWPDGYDTVVGPRADAVSGGQQQRICLARALVSEPSMLVLDEPTSALDPSSEALIQESLQAVQRELTLFIIAHRMSTLSICDRVMVVLDGHLDAFDTLEQLTAHNAYYRHASGIAARVANAEPAAAEDLLGSERSGKAGNGDQPPTRTARGGRLRPIIARYRPPGA